MAGERGDVIGETFESNLPGVFSYSIRQPLGVVLAISPLVTSHCYWRCAKLAGH